MLTEHVLPIADAYGPTAGSTRGTVTRFGGVAEDTCAGAVGARPGREVPSS
jgi:hypothetical protein